MEGSGVIVALIIVTGASALGLLRVVNSSAIARSNTAREIIRSRAAALPERDMQEFLARHKLVSELSDAVKLMNLIADELRVNKDKIAGSYILKDLFSYTDPEDGQIYEPFSYDFVERLSLLADKNKWDDFFATRDAPPINEDELVSLIMNMTVDEFVWTFSPLLK